MNKIKGTLASISIAGLCLATGLLINSAAAASDHTANPPGINAVAVTARYGPLGATANGPSGPATAKFTATPYCCPSSALLLTPTQISTENDFQWMHLGLPWDNTSVSSVTVCYAISTTVVGRTYISQTRLSSMTTPNSALVMLDDGTNRIEASPLCYTVPAAFTPAGALELGLKVVFGSTSDRITIGMISVSGMQ